MSRKLKHRRMREPEKPGYVFTVRGKVQPPEKCERWEKRMDANNVAFSPCSVPGKCCSRSKFVTYQLSWTKPGRNT